MSLASREFATYDEYVYSQGGKARGRRDHLLAHLDKNTDWCAKTFSSAVPYLAPGPVLCLGARTGAESLAFERIGFPGSVGIDLHPVGSTVLEADWHDLPFPEASFANCYSNSLDHCLYLDRLAAGVQRVLKSGGRFYVMATNREDRTEDAWRTKPNNEVLFWQTSRDLIAAICAYGFVPVQEWRAKKWGHHVLRVA